MNIDELDALQAKHNSGRGISCVRSVVSDLRRGDIKGAILEATHDWDKISGYRDVAEWLKANGIAEKEWYISSYAQ